MEGDFPEKIIGKTPNIIFYLYLCTHDYNT